MSENTELNEKDNAGARPSDLEYKIIDISGSNVEERKADLGKRRTKMEAKGWTLLSYQEAGFWKSKATFTRPLSAAMNEKPNKLKPWHYVAIIAGVVFVGYLISGDDAPKPPPEPTQAQLQAKLESAGKELLKKDLVAFGKAKVDVQKEAVALYVKANAIPADLDVNFYYFVSERTYGKDKFMRVSDVLDLAKKEMNRNGGLLDRLYFDLSGVKSQFSPEDGSHKMLNKYVIEHMNDPTSFEHIETRYSVVPYTDGKPPYVKLMMTCRGKNAYGALVINVITAKADIYTGRITEANFSQE